MRPTATDYDRKTGHKAAADRGQLERLAQQIQAIERRYPQGAAPRPVGTGWPEVDRALPGGGLARGALHEWVGQPLMTSDQPPRRSAPWLPPVAVLAHLADRARASQPPGAGRCVVWIGRRCWPYLKQLLTPPADPADPAGRGQPTPEPLLVDPPDAATRLWAIDLALRCPSVAAVVADASGLDMAATRRLQLAAESAAACALLARAPWEQNQPSAASTRWAVAPVPTGDRTPRWRLELLRCRGLAVDPHQSQNNPQPLAWEVVWDARSTRPVPVPAQLADRPEQAPPGTLRRTA